MEKNNYPSWLIPIDIAKKIKQIGFDEECCFVLVSNDKKVGFTTKHKAQYYFVDDIDKVNYNKETNICSIPTWEQVFEWFRSKGYESEIINHYSKDLKCKVGYRYFIVFNNSETFEDGFYETYEKTREELVNKLIEFYNE